MWSGRRLSENFRRRLLAVCAAGVLLWAVLYSVSSRYTIAIGHQHCLDHRVFLVEKGVMPKKNEFVCVRTSGIPYYRDGTRLMKLVAATGGERVRVSYEDRGKPVTLTVDGKERTYILRAYLILERGDGTLRLPIFERGSKGQELPFRWNDGDTVRGLFVIGTHPASYDSRYFGTIDEKMVIGRAFPLF